MTDNDLRNRLLVETAERSARILARPRPRGAERASMSSRWIAEERWGPSFDGSWLPDVSRLRVLAAIGRMQTDGLLRVASAAGEISNVALTDAGRRALAALKTAK
jgi:hypothetical protein